MSNYDKEAVLREASKGILETGKVFFPHYFKLNPSPLHYKLSENLGACIENKENMAVGMPRGIAKTTYIWLFTSVYMALFTDVKYVVYIAKSRDEAKTQLDSKLRRELRENDFLKEFGVTPGRYDVAERISLNVPGRKEELIIDADSQGVNIRGKSIGNQRPQIIILDDVERQQSDTQSGVENPEYRERLWRWLWQQVIPAGEGIGTTLFITGTIMHEDQMLMRILKNPPTYPKTRSMKFGYRGRDKEGNEISLWKEKYPLSDLNNKRRVYKQLGLLDAYYMEYETKLVTEETQLISDNDFRYFNVESKFPVKIKEADTNKVIELRSLPCYIVVDPAMSKSKKSDDAVIETFFVGDDDKRYVYDIAYSNQWDDDDVMDELFKAVKKYRPRKVGIEKEGGQEYFISAIEREMKHRGVFFRIERITGKNMPKLEKIKLSLKSLYKTHKIYHRYGEQYVKKLEDQAKAITRDKIASAHDDLIDCTAMQSKVAPPQVNSEDYKSLSERYRTYLKGVKSDYGIL